MANISTFGDLIQRYKRTRREYNHHIESSVSVMSRLNALLPGMGGGTKKQLSIGAAALLIAITTRRVMHKLISMKHKNDVDLGAYAYDMEDWDPVKSFAYHMDDGDPVLS